MSQTHASFCLLVLASVLTLGCGGVTSTRPPATPPGTVFVFGTDAPACGVESFPVTITSASLLAQGGGQITTVVSPAAPATVDFARLEGFSNLIGTASVPPGKYSELNVSLASPQLVTLNTANIPPTPQAASVTLTSTSFLVPINPPLIVTSATSSGLTFDFNLRQSVQLNGSGQPTGTVDPQITLSPNTSSASSVGEATALYGIAGAPGAAGVSGSYTGSFPLALNDGTGQTVSVLVNDSTVFEGDGVTSLSQVAANDFVEVDAIINTSGQAVAQTVDVEEPTSLANLQSAVLGKVISVTRDANGNALSVTFLVQDVVPAIQGLLGENTSGFVGTALTATLTSSTQYFLNWGQWNQQAFTFGPKTLGVAENVAVFGTFSTIPAFQFVANQVFLRPRSVLGSFRVLQSVESDGITGAFTMAPCGGLFGNQIITVLSYPGTTYSGLSGLNAVSSAPLLDPSGVLMYQPTSGVSTTGGRWTAPTWVMQAREVDQLPN